MVLGILRKHNLEPKQVFLTALTIDGMTKKTATQTLDVRRLKIQRKLQTMYSKTCRSHALEEK